MSRVAGADSSAVRGPSTAVAATIVPPLRHASVDVLRGATALLMVFGWHISTLPDSPAIFRHLDPPGGEGLTIADAVLPAFLFIMGLSIPLADAAQRARGVTTARHLARVLTRTASLLFIGVLFVNAHAEATGWPQRLWSALTLASVLCVWNRIPRTPGLQRRIALGARVLGALTLCVALAAYRRADGTWLHTEWWGILGLIGWTYLAGSLVALAARGRRPLLAAALAAAVGLFALTRAPALQGASWPRLGGWLDLGSVFGTHTAVVIAGTFVGTLLAGPTSFTDARARLARASAFVLALAVGAALLQPHFGLNKLRATPSWALYSAAATGLVWLAAAWLVDVRGKERWTRALRPVGENPLAAYLLYQLVLDVLLLSRRTELFTLGHKGAALAVATSLGFAGLVLVLTTWARRFGPWPRL